MSLYYLSLIPGFSIPLINRVLQATQYLAPPSPLEKVRSRLMDTGAFLAFLMVKEKGIDEGLDGVSGKTPFSKNSTTVPAATLRPGGKGWKMALRVRCLHAKVRRSLLLQTNTQKWDTEHHGVPINQEDMAATLLAFSLNVIYGVEFIAGKSLSDQEKFDYMALWHYVGWLLGVDTTILDPCRTNHPRTHSQITRISSVSSSSELQPFISPTDPLFYPRVLMESILCHIMNPDDSSVSMAHHLLQASMRGDGMTNDSKSMARPQFSFLYRGYLCRKFIGDKLSDQLCLPNPWKDHSIVSILSYILTLALLIMLRLYLRIIIRFPRFRMRAHNSHYRGLNKFLFGWEHGKSSGKLKAIGSPKSCPYYFT
jgi:hypothetical protein